MFSGEAKILDLIAHLQNRKVSLYHACQLQDLISYMKVGGIPARGLLAEAGHSFTGFKSDQNDQKSGDWDRVFLNMNDFGNFFHSRSGSKSTPNIYGPILLKLNPDCIEEAEDVAVCLCSAGSSGFDRKAYSLESVAEVEQLFSHPQSDSYRSSWLKNTPELKKVFSRIPVKGSPEISCTVSSRLIKIDYLTSVVVDPLTYNGFDLIEVVRAVLKGHDSILSTMVKRSTGQGPRYNALVAAVGDGPVKIEDLAKEPLLSEWANGVIANGLDWQFDRFAEYLREGTLGVLQKATPAA